MPAKVKSYRPALCAVLSLCTTGTAVAAEPATGAAQSLAKMPSPAALQAEFLRRIGQSEKISSLFAPGALIPDVSGLRGIKLLPDKNTMQARQVPGSGNVQTGLRVQLRLQAPFSSDCPAVDDYLAQTGENTQTWDETGWMKLTYRHFETGWLITEIHYSADAETTR